MLSDMQNDAVKSITNWFFDEYPAKKFYKLGGVAGSGKTFIIPYLMESLGISSDSVIFCAFTGKATNVMSKKGLAPVSTLHSLLYFPHKEKNNKIKWIRKEKEAIPYDFIAVDEASMVSEKIHKDLLLLEKPILYIGDYFQLPPINSTLNLMEESGLDFKLTEIHRQAKENPIIYYSMQIREGFKIGWTKTENSEFCKIPYKTFEKYEDNYLVSADQVICGYNNTRNIFNSRIRNLLGFEGLPKENEKLIFLRNQKDNNIINGLQFYLTKSLDEKEMDPFFKGFYASYVEDYLFESYKSKKEGILLETNDFVNIFDITPYTLVKYTNIQADCFLEDVEIEYSNDDYFIYSTADFGYVITCHKSQGSEWDKVILIDDEFGKNKDIRNKWLYTAVTRAKKKIMWAVA
jgi:exodeoxyribonuclease V